MGSEFCHFRLLAHFDNKKKLADRNTPAIKRKTFFFLQIKQKIDIVDSSKITIGVLKASMERSM